MFRAALRAAVVDRYDQTPVELVNQANIAPMHEHWLVWHLLKINGGFEILRRGDDYVLDYGSRTPGAIMRFPGTDVAITRAGLFRPLFPHNLP